MHSPFFMFTGKFVWCVDVILDGFYFCFFSSRELMHCIQSHSKLGTWNETPTSVKKYSFDTVNFSIWVPSLCANQYLLWFLSDSIWMGNTLTGNSVTMYSSHNVLITDFMETNFILAMTNYAVYVFNDTKGDHLLHNNTPNRSSQWYIVYSTLFMFTGKFV